MQEQETIYDWNRFKKGGPFSGKKFEILDETLRDGLQSPSATDPRIEEKIGLLHLMEDLGVSAASLGLPGAGSRVQAHTQALAAEIGKRRMRLKPTCAARTTLKDIQPIADIVQKTGVPIEVYTFIASSPIRLYAQDWSVDFVLKSIEEAVRFGLREGLQMCLVTEDTTRSRPQDLYKVFRHAISLGVRRLCIADTVGFSTPDGVRNILVWTLGLIQAEGEEVKVDWHGHNDRGLAVANALYAIEYGADRVHGTGVGVGERVGNAALDQILVNLKLFDAWPHDLSSLGRYCDTVARICNMPIPYNYPISGRDAFRTGTGVHAAAIIKARAKGDVFLADRIYSAVPAALVGRQQVIEVGPVSGQSNITYWLKVRNVPQDEALIAAIYEAAKAADRVLREEEIWWIVRKHKK